MPVYDVPPSRFPPAPPPPHEPSGMLFGINLEPERPKPSVFRDQARFSLSDIVYVLIIASIGFACGLALAAYINS